jgi:hypothetical protein
MIDEARTQPSRDLDKEARYTRADLEDFAAAQVAKAQATLPPPSTPPGPPSTTPVPEAPPRKKGRLAAILFGADPGGG